MTTPTAPNSPVGCIFCGERSPLSNEHVFRDTLRKHFRSQTGLDLFSESAPDRTGHLPISMFDRKVKAVCEPCNRGWLNDLDAELEDLLVSLFRADQRRISRAELRRLAFWAAVRAAVRGQTELKATQVAIAPYAAQTMKLGLPPEGTTVWLGLTDIPLTLDGFRHHGMQVVDKEDGSEHAMYHFFQHTVALNRALFVVVGSPSLGVGADLARRLGHGLDLTIQESPVPLARIWPRPRPLDWPSTPPVPPGVVATELHNLAVDAIEGGLSEMQDGD